jgi:protein-disulfide isomerase
MWKPGLLVLLLSACGSGPAATTASPSKVAAPKAMHNRVAVAENEAAEIDLAAAAERIDAEIPDRSQFLKQTYGSAKPDPAATYAVPVGGSPFVGPAVAPVTIVVGGEFACPFCEKNRKTLAELRTIYGDQLKIVHKSFIVHDLAFVPALAACAAHHQGMYDAYAAELWTRVFGERKFATEHILRVAESLGLSMEDFIADVEGDACLQAVEGDYLLLRGLGMRGTPGFFINGRWLSGAQPTAAFQTLIDEELRKANEAIARGATLEGYYESLVRTGRTAP